MAIVTVGIDLTKNVSAVHGGVDETDKPAPVTSRPAQADCQTLTVSYGPEGMFKRTPLGP